MNRGDFAIGFFAGLFVGVGISASKAADFTSTKAPPPVVITVTLPEVGTAQFICEQTVTYPATKEIPK